MISNPGNPTGVVYSKEELETLAEVAKEKDLFIISDEVYREFTYDGLTCTSFGNIKGVADRVIIVDSVSKRYSACGARIGSLCTKTKTSSKKLLNYAKLDYVYLLLNKLVPQLFMKYLKIT